MRLNQFLYNHPIVSYVGIMSGLVFVLSWLSGNISEHLLIVTMSVYFGSLITLVFFGVYGQAKAEVRSHGLRSEWEKLNAFVAGMRDSANNSTKE